MLPAIAQQPCHWVACQQHCECRQYLRSLWWAAGSWHLHLLSRHLLSQHSSASASRVGEPPAGLTACRWGEPRGRHGIKAGISRQAVAKAPTGDSLTRVCGLCAVLLCCAASLTLLVGAHIAAALCILGAIRTGQPFCARAACSGMWGTPTRQARQGIHSVRGRDSILRQHPWLTAQHGHAFKQMARNL